MARNSKRKSKARVVVRPLRLEDLDQVQALHGRCYPGLAPWTREQLQSQIQHFPAGQICVEFDGKIVATSSSLIVDSSELDEQHTYSEVCDRGYISNHNQDGDFLYGIDIAVDPDRRGLRLARRLYDARKQLVQTLNLKGIVIGGRLPRYHKYADKMSAEEYVRQVLQKAIRDPVITAQRANGFTARGLMPGYLPNDKDSCGYALLMEWHNSNWIPASRPKRTFRSIRVAAVQYQMRSIKDFDEFATQCEFFIDTASEYLCDFILFPELLTNQLLALVPASRPAESARKLHKFTASYSDFFTSMAIKYNVNILAGTHLTVEDDTLYNIAYLFHRDGRIDKQYKIHITPSEARWWGISPGHSIEVFDTDRARVAIAICYDVEFPEVARILKAKGASVVFVPYNTDIRAGHLRVRGCAQARAIENNLYIVTAGAVGNLPQVEGADIHYAQSAILTPSDIAFARDGVAAEATPNVETMLVHDLDLATLRKMEASGTVRTWLDRRKDVYEIHLKLSDDTQVI